MPLDSTLIVCCPVYDPTPRAAPARSPASPASCILTREIKFAAILIGRGYGAGCRMFRSFKSGVLIAAAAVGAALSTALSMAPSTAAAAPVLGAMLSAVLRAAPSAAAAINTPDLKLRNIRHPAPYPRPIKIAANFISLVKMQLAGDAGDLAGAARGVGS